MKRRFLIDTNHLASAIHPVSKLRDRIYTEHRAGTVFRTITPVLCELEAGIQESRFVDANFDFRGKELLGQPENRPRWKRGLTLVERSMGEAVGRDYVNAYFPAESKAKMEAPVADLRGQLDR